MSIYSEPSTANVMQSLALYQGNLPPDDCYEEWMLFFRERLNHYHRDARLMLMPLLRLVDSRSCNRLGR